ncbi:uncharacterized protein SAPINGB_P002713 [Magnusiomyces paraingens]|uniref:Uncharacterized protein n=1 Tax=Magnusiomyces paraingens TaxID=2606893 RepID=A0A5E8BL44_9ASCO|nr:uncharacterized protein SAPINGB_P002713 [Saprochaete ingens]VVT50338.1 unnamed protein product [Saprochaete ingens]
MSSQKRLFDSLSGNLGEINRIVSEYASSSGSNGDLVIPREHVATLINVLEVAQGKITRLVKKAKRPEQKFSDPLWQLLDNHTCVELTGFSKIVVEEIADALTAIDVHSACGHRIGRREALSITLCKFHRDCATGDFLETSFGRPASVISKVVNHVITAVMGAYRNLLSLGSNPYLCEERVRSYAAMARLEKPPSPAGSIPYYVKDDRPHSAKELKLAEQRDHIFASLSTRKIRVHVPIKEDWEPYIDPETRSYIIRYVSVVAPDGLTIGLYGQCPGQVTDVGVLHQKLASRDLARFSYQKKTENGTVGDEKEQFYLYAGWMFDAVEDDVDLSEGIITSKMLTQDYLESNNLAQKFVIGPNLEPNSGDMLYRCGACRRSLKYQLDDPDTWRTPNNLATYTGSFEVQHWWSEKRTRDRMRQPGEDDFLWRLKFVSFSAGEDIQEKWCSMSQNRSLDYSQRHVDDKIRFCVLFLNMVRCVNRTRSEFDALPPTLHSYLDRVRSKTANDSDPIAPPEIDRGSEDFIQEWGGIPPPSKRELRHIPPRCRG